MAKTKTKPKVGQILDLGLVLKRVFRWKFNFITLDDRPSSEHFVNFPCRNIALKKEVGPN